MSEQLTTAQATAWRNAVFLVFMLPGLGLARYAEVGPLVLQFTGYERPVETIRLDDPMLRLLGSLLGSADIIAQMSDRCYLEKCRDRLYPEFVEGGITHKKTVKGDVVVIPNGVPHWFKEVKAPFLYYVVKVRQANRSPEVGVAP